MIPAISGFCMTVMELHKRLEARKIMQLVKGRKAGRIAHLELRGVEGEVWL